MSKRFCALLCSAALLLGLSVQTYATSGSGSNACASTAPAGNPNDPLSSPAVTLNAAVGAVGAREVVPVVEPNMPSVGDSYVAEHRSRSDAQASSTYRLIQSGSRTMAILTQELSCNDPNQVATASGVVYLQIYVAAGEGDPNGAQVLVEKYQTMYASEGASGVAKFDGVDHFGTGFYTHSEETWYTVEFGEEVGGWIPVTLVLDNDMELDGVGTLSCVSHIGISVRTCETDSPPPPDPDDDEDDPEDDEVDPDPNDAPCAGPEDAGDGLHMRLTTGNVWTQVPVLRTYAEGDVEAELVLRFDSNRAGQDGLFGYGWTLSGSGLARDSRQTAAPIGPGMSLDAIWHVVNNPPFQPYWERGDLVLVDGKGRQHRFFKDGAIYRSPIGRSELTLEVINPTTNVEFQLTYPDGVSVVFGPPWHSVYGHTPLEQRPGKLHRVYDRNGNPISLTYAEEQLTQYETRHGRVVTFQYNEDGRVWKIVHPDNTFTTLAYYPNGNLYRVIDDDWHIQEFEYDGQHRVTKETLRNGVFYTALYNTNERVLKDKNGREIVRAMCPMGFPATRSDEMEHGWVIHVDANQQRWQLRRDNLGRLRETVSPTMKVRHSEYGDAEAEHERNRLIEMVNERGESRKMEYDSNGHITKITDEAGHEEEFEYDGPFDQMSLHREADGDEWQYEYYTSGPENGRLYQVIDPLDEADPCDVALPLDDDAVMTYTYDHDGNNKLTQVTQTDRNGHVTVYDYNAGGNVWRVTRGSGSLNLVTLYGYDGNAMGQPTTKTVQRGGTSPDVVTAWAYDTMGRLLSSTRTTGGDPLVTTYEYDAYGNLTGIINPRLTRTTFEYDDRNRLYQMIADDDPGGTDPNKLKLTTTWALDGNGHVVQVTNPKQETTTYDYDADGRLWRIVDAEGFTTLLNTDPAGMVEKVRRARLTGPYDLDASDEDFYTQVFDYDEINRLTSRIVDPGEGALNLTTTYEYTPVAGCGSCSGATPGSARPKQIVDPKGKIALFEYDDLDRLTKITRQVGATVDADDAVTAFEYDPMGNLKKMTGPEGEQVEFEYDAANRRTVARTIVSEAPYEAIEFGYEYDGAGNVIGLTRPDAGELTMTYDRVNRLEQISDLLGEIATLTYDENGNVLTRSTGLKNEANERIQTAEFQYDALDRVIVAKDPERETTPADAYTQFDYHDDDSLHRNLLEVIDRNGGRTLKEFDALGRLVSLIENYGGADATANTETTYGYNGLRQTSITDPNQGTTTYDYDDALRLIAVTFPDSLGGKDQVTYGYDAAGNLASRTDQRDIVTTYSYNDLHQLVGRDYFLGQTPLRSEAFAFDRSGRLKSAANDISDVDLVYDAIGRPITATQTFIPEVGDPTPYVTTYDYVVAQNQLSQTVNYPTTGRAVTASMDKRSRLASVLDQNSVGVAWDFDLGNRRDVAHLSNGALSAFDYDLNNRLLQIRHANMVNDVLVPFYDVQYGYDPLGNRLWKRDNIETDRSETYQYDERNRLVDFRRGLMAPNEPVIATPSNDVDLPARQSWKDPLTGAPLLDSRGNWTAFQMTVAGTATEQTRTLNNTGGKANEYNHIHTVVGGLEVYEQLTYDAAGNLVATDLMGDMNCDGIINFADINAFVMAVTNPTLYAQTYPSCMIELGDLDGNGQIQYADINLFVDLLLHTGSAEPRRYEYDEENRLIAVKDFDDNVLLEMQYDALGRRIGTWDYAATSDPCGGAASAVATRHIYNGLSVIEEHVWCSLAVGGGAWVLAREFLWGDRFPEPLVLIDHTALGDKLAADPTGPEVLHYVRDALGSVVGLVDAGDPEAQTPVLPALVERYDYDPYGHTYIESGDGLERRTASKYGNPFAWTGQRYDAGVGLYHFLYRSYSPELGRWLQRDPAGYVDGTNLYEYARSSPSVYVDPLGLSSGFFSGGSGFGGGGGDDGFPPPPPSPGEPDPCGGGSAWPPGGDDAWPPEGSTAWDQDDKERWPDGWPVPPLELGFYEDWLQGLRQAYVLYWLFGPGAVVNGRPIDDSHNVVINPASWHEQMKGMRDNVQAFFDIKDGVYAFLAIWKNTAGLFEGPLMTGTYFVCANIGGGIAEAMIFTTGCGWAWGTDKYTPGRIFIAVNKVTPKVWAETGPDYLQPDVVAGAVEQGVGTGQSFIWDVAEAVWRLVENPNPYSWPE